MKFGNQIIDLSTPKVMGVLNVTPDSFYDGGQYFRSGDDISRALSQAEAMISAGASFIDIGGESTRPGAESVGVDEEMSRVLPVVEAINTRFDTVISLDTSTPEVMKEGISLGAAMINDVRALQLPGAIQAAKASDVPICLMHMKGAPDNMQNNPMYDDVVAQVTGFLQQRVDVCEAEGIAPESLILDPGFGFGKTDEHNIRLLKRLPDIVNMGFPVLAGLSRKSLLGRLLGRKPEQRLAGSLALAQYALQYGANILRVHDVAETVDIVNMFQIMNQEKAINVS